jgi:hypothetical protein
MGFRTRLAAGLLVALATFAPVAWADEPADRSSYFTKRVSAGEVKVYAKNPIGVGKVQFVVNGREVAWVRAASARDPKLRMVTLQGETLGYLVRTAQLVAGQKNVIEIWVDNRRAWHVAYTR